MYTAEYRSLILPPLLLSAPVLLSCAALSSTLGIKTDKQRCIEQLTAGLFEKSEQTCERGLSEISSDAYFDNSFAKLHSASGVMVGEVAASQSKDYKVESDKRLQQGLDEVSQWNGRTLRARTEAMRVGYYYDQLKALNRWREHEVARGIIKARLLSVLGSLNTSPTLTSFDTAMASFRSSKWLKASMAGTEFMRDASFKNVPNTYWKVEAYASEIALAYPEEFATIALWFSELRKGLALNMQASLNQLGRRSGQVELTRSLRKARGELTTEVYRARSKVADKDNAALDLFLSENPQMRAYAGVSKMMQEAEGKDHATQQRLGLEALQSLDEASQEDSPMVRANRRVQEIEEGLADLAQDRPDSRAGEGLPLVPERGLTSAEILAERLSRRAALIAYTRFETTLSDPQTPGLRYAAFVLQPGGTTSSVIDLGNAADIEHLISGFVGVVQSPGVSASRVKAESAALTAKIFEPLKAYLEEGVDKLIIAPDGDLYRVPFAALLDEDAYLVDRFEISYSASYRPEKDDDPTALDQELRAVVIADPALPKKQYEDPKLDPSNYRRLPGARAEGDVIGSALGLEEIVKFTNEEAHEQVLDSIGSPTILHIASHGTSLDAVIRSSADPTRGVQVVEEAGKALPRTDTYLQNKAGDESGWMNAILLMATSDTETPGYDGYLSAYEIAALDLSTTELVVLSACETGVGAAGAWHGTFSLQQGFVAAGADSVVATLWQVPDAATLELMKAFYTQLGQGAERSAALRAAQRATRETHEHPFYWASFTLHGQTGPLMQ